MSIWSVPRVLGFFALVVFATCGALQAALADAIAADCATRKNVLGVSRVVEVDTTGGLRFGRAQYKDFSFLKEGEVVLTFDDGPLRRYSTEVLKALEAECTKAIFFMVGRMAVTDPHMVREIARRGHTIGTHTWKHKNLGRQSKSRAQTEIELGFSAVSAALGRPVAPFFRFPYLSDSNRLISYLKKRNVGIFSIDVDSKDFRTRSGPAMVSRTLTGIKRNGNKGVLLFHDIQRSTAAGVHALLRKLKRGGYKVVHLIAKEPVATIASYDEMAERELNRRKKSWSTRPFVKKKVPWPVSTGGLPASQPLAFLTPPAAAANGKTKSMGRYVDGDEPKELPKKVSSGKAKGERTHRSSLSSSKPSAKKALRSGIYVDPLQSKVYSD